MAIDLDPVDCPAVRRPRHTGQATNRFCWAYPTNPPLTASAITVISSCMTDDDFQLQVEAFISRHKMSPTTFGIWAMDDSRFVFDLRQGRNCFGRTIRRVQRFMDTYDQKQAAKKLHGAIV